MARTTVLISLATAAGLLLIACGQGPEPPARPWVAVSVPPQALLVEKIAGDLVETVVMVPPGANPTTHEPTMAQMRALSNVALYLALGHPSFAFERAWLEPILRSHPELQQTRLLEAGAATGDDPHVWLSPVALRAMARQVEAALVELLPQHHERLAAGRGQFEAELAATDVRIREMLAPYQGRSFYVFHPAWGHFARAYGLRQAAIEGEGHEPSPHELKEVIDAAAAAGATTIFVQPQFSSRTAEVAAQEIGGALVTVDPLARDCLKQMEEMARELVRSFEP